MKNIKKEYFHTSLTSQVNRQRNRQTLLFTISLFDSVHFSEMDAKFDYMSYV